MVRKQPCTRCASTEIPEMKGASGLAGYETKLATTAVGFGGRGTHGGRPNACAVSRYPSAHTAGSESSPKSGHSVLPGLGGRGSVAYARDPTRRATHGSQSVAPGAFTMILLFRVLYCYSCKQRHSGAGVRSPTSHCGIHLHCTYTAIATYTALIKSCPWPEAVANHKFWC